MKCSNCRKGRPSHFFYDAKTKTMKALCGWCYNHDIPKKIGVVQ